jgi:hypothetical protein
VTHANKIETKTVLETNAAVQIKINGPWNGMDTQKTI